MLFIKESDCCRCCVDNVFFAGENDISPLSAALCVMCGGIENVMVIDSGVEQHREVQRKANLHHHCHNDGIFLPDSSVRSTVANIRAVSRLRRSSVNGQAWQGRRRGPRSFRTPPGSHYEHFLHQSSPFLAGAHFCLPP